MHELTAYQSEIVRAVLDSVLHDRGLTFTVEIARGGGARELSAQLELLLLSLHVNDGVRLLSIAPPGSDRAQGRLIDLLRGGTLQGLWSAEGGTVRLGRSLLRYLTPDELGPTLIEPRPGTAGLIEVAGAERVEPNVYSHWLVPLADATGATIVLYGLPVNGETRFEELKQRNQELETVPGLQRHFRVTGEQVACALPGYRSQMDEARDRLGEDHPEFQRAYLLRPTATSGPLLPAECRMRLESGARHREPIPCERTVASIVVTRLPSEQAATAPVPVLLANPGAGAVVTIARHAAPGQLDVIEHRWLQAVDTASLARRVVKVVCEWRCERVVAEQRADAGAQGGAFSMLLERGLDRTPAEWVTADEGRDSRLALGLIAAVHTGRVRLYRVDGSPEHRALRHELESAVADYGADGELRVRQPAGDEGFVRGLALVVGTFATAPREGAGERETALAS